jgi:hypothetical protein
MQLTSQTERSVCQDAILQIVITVALHIVRQGFGIGIVVEQSEQGKQMGATRQTRVELGETLCIETRQIQAVRFGHDNCLIITGIGMAHDTCARIVEEDA